MPSEPTESRSERLIRLVREWFPVFLRMVDMVVQYEVLRQRGEFVRHLATKQRQDTRHTRNRGRDCNNNDESAVNNTNNT